VAIDEDIGGPLNKILAAMRAPGMMRAPTQRAMDPPAAKISLHPAMQRLLLAASAAAILAALGWAALRVHQLETEVRALRQDLAASRRAERATGAASRAVPVVDHGARVAQLQRLLTAAETQHKQTVEKASAREKELDGVIAFLRTEIDAAQQTIERLSNLTPDPAPANSQPTPNFRDPVRRQP
jgi:hypothetical protein